MKAGIQSNAHSSRRSILPVHEGFPAVTGLNQRLYCWIWGYQKLAESISHPLHRTSVPLLRFSDSQSEKGSKTGDTSHAVESDGGHWVSSTSGGRGRASS
jgi:hypothetical protein